MSPDSTNQQNLEKPILFFDGVCGLCNHFVDLLFAIDHNHIYNVAALQGKTAEKLLPKTKIENLSSLVIYRDGQILEKSTAVLTIAKDLGGAWSLLYLLIWIPRPLRDLVYDLIASVRYQIFGKKETCRLPTLQERARFLD